MKVSATHHVTVLEDEWIVSRGVQLATYDSFNPVERIEDRPVNLRHAAKSVGILHARIPNAVGFPELALFHQIAEKLG